MDFKNRKINNASYHFKIRYNLHRYKSFNAIKYE